MNSKLTRVLVAFLLVANSFGAISLFDRFGASAAELKGVLPATNTALITTTFYVAHITIINNASSQKTVNIRGRGTDCGGSPCNLVPTDLVIAANTMYVIEMPWVEANSGIQFSASDGTSVQYKIIGTY